MNLLAIYDQGNGMVSEIYPAPEARRAGEGDAAFVSRIAVRDAPSGAPLRLVTLQQLPDGDFRDAWRFGAQEPTIDMDHAKEIQKGKWRVAREPLLKALDVEMLRAVEEDDKVKLARIAKDKQDLRDVTATDLSAVSTPAELKAVWPTVLGAKR